MGAGGTKGPHDFLVPGKRTAFVPSPIVDRQTRRRHVSTSPPIVGEPPFKALQVIINTDEEADVWILDARIVAYYQAGPLCVARI